MDTTDETLKALAKKVYAYIHKYLKENAKSPTHREIIEGLRAEETHISTETLARVLNFMDKDSDLRIRRVRGRGRQIWVPIRDCPDEKEA